LGRLAAKIVVLNYTQLYAFTAFYHLFLAVNVTNRIEGYLATDETRTKHRFGRDIEQEETEKTEVGRKRTQRTQKGAGNRVGRKWSMGVVE